jgi:hypothetical protein
LADLLVPLAFLALIALVPSLERRFPHSRLPRLGVPIFVAWAVALSPVRSAGDEGIRELPLLALIVVAGVLSSATWSRSGNSARRPLPRIATIGALVVALLATHLISTFQLPAGLIGTIIGAVAGSIVVSVWWPIRRGRAGLPPAWLAPPLVGGATAWVVGAPFVSLVVVVALVSAAGLWLATWTQSTPTRRRR